MRVRHRVRLSVPLAFAALAATLALIPASSAVAQMKSEIPPLPDMQLAEIPAASRANYQGDRFSYMEAGRADAPVVLLLHGVGANSMHWRYQFAGLSDRYRVIAWNAPGYMFSDGFVKDVADCKDYADSVRDFLTALKIERPVNIVGNSFGSRVGQCFAMYYPDRVIKLAMTGTGVGPKDMPEDQKQKILAAREPQAKAIYSYGNRVSVLFGPNVSPDIVAEMQRVLRMTMPRGFMHGVKLGMVNGYSPQEVGAKLAMPVLLIQGRVDKINPGDRNAELLIKELKNGKLVWMEAIGHLPEIEAPGEVNTMLRDFFG